MRVWRERKKQRCLEMSKFSTVGLVAVDRTHFLLFLRQSLVFTKSKLLLLRHTAFE